MIVNLSRAPLRAVSASRCRRVVISTLVGAILAACGGNKDDEARIDPASLPASRSEAAMFLSKATFGPTEGDVDRVMSIGYSAWIDEQFATPAASHRASWEAADAAIKAADPMSVAGQDPVFFSFWK